MVVVQAYIRLCHANVSDVEQTLCLSEEYIRNVPCDRQSQYRANPKDKEKVCFLRQTVRRSHFHNIYFTNCLKIWQFFKRVVLTRSVKNLTDVVLMPPL